MPDNKRVDGMSLDERAAVLSHFEQRVNSAQGKHPPTKALVKEAVRRRNPPRCPMRLKRLSLNIIMRYGDDLADLFCEYPDDVICVSPYDYSIGHQVTGKPDRVNPLAVLLDDAEWMDEWGTRWGHSRGGVGATPVDIPLKEWSQLDEYLAVRFPDPDAPGRLDPALPVLNLHKDSKYCCGTIYAYLFEHLHFLRGMEDTLVDLYTNETEVFRLMERLQEFHVRLIRAWAKTGVDAIFLTEDFGSQRAMMISPEMWRKYFKAHYRSAFEEMHKCGMDVIYHSCGNIMPIIPDLIDIGLDVLDPVQPGAMDIEEVAKEFGGKISFQGCIDDQNLLAFASPQTVKDTIRRIIDAIGRPFGNGLILSPANVMTPEIPLANLKAMFEACHEM